MSRDDGNSTRPSLRTFILYYLLQQQTASSTSTVTTRPPYNATINITNSVNTTDVNLNIRSRSLGLKHIDVPDPDGQTFQRYMVPVKYFDLVKDLVEEYKEQATEHDIVYEEDDEVDEETTVANRSLD